MTIQQPNVQSDIQVSIVRLEARDRICSILIHNSSRHQNLIASLQPFLFNAGIGIMPLRTLSVPFQSDNRVIHIQLSSPSDALTVYNILTNNGMVHSIRRLTILIGISNGVYLGEAEIGEFI